MGRWILLFALNFGHALCNCAYGTSMFPRLPDVPVMKFGYDGLKGPLNWFGLNETANGMCDKGSNQSPIVINSNITMDEGSKFQWSVPDYPQGTKFENLGTNVQVVVNGSLVDTEAETSYKLAQFHFHIPSEHRIDDEIFASEMHWVFESEAKQFAVIGFIIELTNSTDFVDPVLSSLFSSIGGIPDPGEAEDTGPLFFDELIAKFSSGTVWKYSGSLTTPPCTEQVLWLISNNYLYLDLPTWQAVKKVVKFNARFSQDTPTSINLLQNAANELDNATSTK